MKQAESQQHQIDLAAVFAALERPLGLVDSPERRADLQRYIDSARIHLERAIFDLLSGVVSSFNEASPGARARLEYQGGALNLVVEAAAAEEEEPEPEPFNVEGDMEKVTIRIPAELKDLIDRAASLRGISMNSWYVRELGRSISKQVRDQIRDQIREQTRDARNQRREERREERHERHGPGGSLHGFVGED